MMKGKKSEYFWPNEASIGKNCLLWDTGEGCTFPKKEMERRRSCEGVIDDVCLYLKDGRPPKSLTSEQLLELKLRVPGMSPMSIPPGNTKL